MTAIAIGDIPLFAASCGPNNTLLLGRLEWKLHTKVERRQTISQPSDSSAGGEVSEFFTQRLLSRIKYRPTGVSRRSFDELQAACNILDSSTAV